MKKILAILILCLISVFSLVGCGGSYNEPPTESEMFIEIRIDTGAILSYIYVHKETKVMYLFVKNGSGAGLVVMLDENGKPLLWQGE